MRDRKNETGKRRRRRERKNARDARKRRRCVWLHLLTLDIAVQYRQYIWAWHWEPYSVDMLTALAMSVLHCISILVEAPMRGALGSRLPQGTMYSRFSLLAANNAQKTLGTKNRGEAKYNPERRRETTLFYACPVRRSDLPYVNFVPGTTNTHSYCF